MPKTTPEQFEDFKRSFLEWRKKLGLTEWRIFFEIANLKNKYAQIYYDTEKAGATVRFAKQLENDEMKNCDPKESGKHECLHLLLADLYTLGENREFSQREFNTAEEKIVRRLEGVL